MTSPLGTSDTGNPSPAPQSPHQLAPVHGTLMPREAVPLEVRQALAPLPPALSAAPNATTLLRALKRRLVLALTVGFLVAVLAGTMTWFLIPPPKMTARTIVHVKSSPPTVLAPNASEADMRFLRSQVSLIKDPFIIRKALREPGIQNLSTLQNLSVDQAQWLEEQIQVKIEPPEHLHITLSGDKPDELLALVKAVTRVYMSEVMDATPRQHSQQMDILHKVQRDFEKRMRSQKDRLKKLEDDVGPALPELIIHQQKIAKEELKAAEMDLVKIRAERRKAQLNLGLPQNFKGGPAWQRFAAQRFAAAMTTLPGPIPPMNFVVVRLFHNDPSGLPFVLEDFPVPEPPEPGKAVVEEALDKMFAKQMAEIQMGKKYLEELRRNAKHPEKNDTVKKAQARLDRLEKAAKDLRDESRDKVIKGLRQEMAAKAQIERTNDFKVYVKLRETEDMLAAQVSRLVEEAKDTKKKVNDIAQLREEIAGLEKIWEKAGEKRLTLEVEQQAPGRITWMGWKYVKDEKEDEGGELDEAAKAKLNREREGEDAAMIIKPDLFKKRILITVGATLAPFALILLGFAFLEFRTRKVHAPEEVVQALGMRLIGTVPDLTHRSWRKWLRPSGGAGPGYVQHMLTESVDAARTLVLHTARTEPLQVVMITSALAGEGKTSLASHLAASLARSGRRTLLVDCDLRNPALHQLFDLERGPGLSELLRGDIDLPNALRPTAINNLWMVPAGHGDGAALQALAQDGIGPIFQQLRQQYDFVVVDSCPVLPVVDSLLVGQHVDAVIFSLLREVSRLPKVYMAYQRLAVLGVRMLGAVVNGTRDDLVVGDYHYVSPDH